MERIALKLGYLGTQYHGFQIQPQSVGPTIEGELFKAFEKLNIIEERVASNYSAAGRTDKGVHALSQVVSFDTTNPNVTPRMIKSMLPDDIWAFALAKPYSDFNARRDATSREYRYFLPLQPDVGLDITRMREASELLIGAHDFSNFAQPPGHHEHEAEYYSPIREIKRVEIATENSFVVIDIEANGFLRKMVRKIVSALKLVGGGTKNRQWVEDLAELRVTEHIEPAPAFGLILKKVSYRNVEFVEDEYAKRRIAARLNEELAFHATMAEVLDDMVSAYVQL
ncbi:tRNA pseudouridine(38-40) synthase TruA [ANME-1 cluster archaeon GoMg4]|nr:tRNA pseudouridine(38-40) synthase TruA [ANME-1 cluster archaeon GoMg4]